MRRTTFSVLALALAAGCSGAATPPAAPPPKPSPAAIPAPPPAPDAWRESRPEPGAITPVTYPAAETTRLENGLSVFVVRKPGGVATLSLVARGGASTLPAGKSGLAALAVRMMTEGTTRQGALALAEAAESMGTVLEQSAGRDFVRLGMTTLADDLARGLGLLSEVAQKPAFAPAELQRVRKEWLDGIEAERQSPSRLASLVGLRLLLGTTTGAPVSGSRRDVQALTRADLVRFHHDAFVPENVALVVVGDVTLDAVRPLAMTAFGSWRSTAPRAKPAAAPTAPAASAVASPAAVAPQTPLVANPAAGGATTAAATGASAATGAAATRAVIVDRPGAVQTAVFVAQPFPSRTEPGYEARELLNGLFGGLFTSRLNLNLREKHAYTYGATSVDIATLRWGAFAIMTSVRTDATADALLEALDELRKARDPALGRPIAPEEVARARVDLAQHLGSSLAHTAEVAGRTEGLFVHGLDSGYYAKYPALLDSVDAQQVAGEARRLDPEHAVIVLVGDRSAVADGLAARQITVVPAEEALTN